MRVTLDPAIPAPADWQAVSAGAAFDPLEEAIGAMLVALMGAGHAPESIGVRCGRRALILLARATGQSITLDGVPSVRFYSVAGVVTVREDTTLEQEEIAFGPRRSEMFVRGGELWTRTTRGDEVRLTTGPSDPAPCLPTVERYVLATTDIPGGQIFAGVGYGGGPDVVGLGMVRATLRRIIASIGETFAQSEQSLTVETADKITGFVEEDMRRRFPARAWFIEVWNEREALTQTYAPWGRPRTR